MFSGKDIVKKRGNYYYASTKKKISQGDLDRIHSLGIPPAYKSITLSTSLNSRIQAVSIDSRNRKQYTYHPSFVKKSSLNKYKRLYHFIKAQTRFWKKVLKDHGGVGITKQKTISYMFCIMKETHIRVGNKKYADSNKSFGLTTLQLRHIKFLPTSFELQFRGKSGVDRTLRVKDKETLRFTKKLCACKKSPRNKLFQTETFNILSEDLNKYLQNSIGSSFTCKDFRTLAANTWFIHFLREAQGSAKKNISSSLEQTAKKLGHTKSTSKNSYVFSTICKEYLENPRCIHKRTSVRDTLLYFLKKII